MGYGGCIQPAWNITDNNSVGAKMVWAYHDETNGSGSFSALVNYIYSCYGKPNEIPNTETKLVGFYGGVGIGVCTGPLSNKDSLGISAPSETSFAMMPFVGIRYAHFHLNGDYHFAAGNKHNTWFGFSAGIIFGGGLIYDINKKKKH